MLNHRVRALDSHSISDAFPRLLVGRLVVSGKSLVEVGKTA
jgi:hypothetical protein